MFLFFSCLIKSDYVPFLVKIRAWLPDAFRIAQGLSKPRTEESSCLPAHFFSPNPLAPVIPRPVNHMISLKSLQALHVLFLGPPSLSISSGGLANFFLQRQIVSMWGFVGHIPSLQNIPLFFLQSFKCGPFLSAEEGGISKTSHRLVVYPPAS